MLYKGTHFACAFFNPKFFHDIFNSCISAATQSQNEIVLSKLEGDNSVLTRIKAVQPHVRDIRCICHVANLCCQQGVKQLIMPVDELLIDVLYHFAHSAEFLDYQLSGENELPVTHAPTASGLR